MEIVKKNLLSIICGVVALICVILLFFPLGGMFEGLRSKVQQSATVGKSIDKESKTPRNWPVLNPAKGGTVELGGMPTPGTISVGKKMTEGWSQLADEFLRKAVGLQVSNLKPLVDGALPNGGQAQRSQFQYLYQYRFTVRNEQNIGRPVQDNTVFHTILNAGLPPTPEEIKAVVDETTRRVRESKARVVGVETTNEAEVVKAIADATATVPDQERLAAARKFNIYVDPAEAVTPVAEVNSSRNAPTADVIFDAQVRLWVIEELCRGIAITNKAAAARLTQGRNSDAQKQEGGVYASPVKRLLRISVQHNYRTVPPVPGTAVEPTAAPANPAAKLEFDYKTNPFGQKSNDFYDVLQFKLQFIAEADSLPETLVGISKNHYTMFRSVRIVAVDSASEAVLGYLYGDKPVVRVEIEGQYLFLRQFIGPYMPPGYIRGLVADPAVGPGMSPESNFDY